MIRNKLVAPTQHSMTKNLQDFEIDKVSLILCANNENIKQLLYFLGGAEIVPYWLKESKYVQNMSNIPNLNFSNHYHLHAKYFLCLQIFLSIRPTNIKFIVLCATAFNLYNVLYHV